MKLSFNQNTKAECALAGTMRPRAFGFTLLELLVVIGIIGILATVTLPSLKGLGRSNRTAASNRQILDDLGAARARAINERTTVFMVFLPPDLHTIDYQRYTQAEQKEINRLLAGQLTSYALVARRSVGDQPGADQPRYLSDWRPLPEGMMVPLAKFDRISVKDWPSIIALERPLLRLTGIPFPFASSRSDYALPAIGFDSRGQLFTPTNLNENDRDFYLTLTEGSVFVPRDGNGNPIRAAVDAVETPQGNREVVRINWLTGRAEVIRPQLP